MKTKEESKKNKRIRVHLLDAIILVVVVGVVVIVLLKTPEVYYNQLVKLNCCESNECSGIYYTQEDNQCHIAGCIFEPINGMFGQISPCDYSGKGVVINVSLI